MDERWVLIMHFIYSSICKPLFFWRQNRCVSALLFNSFFNLMSSIFCYSENHLWKWVFLWDKLKICWDLRRLVWYFSLQIILDPILRKLIFLMKNAFISRHRHHQLKTLWIPDSSLPFPSSWMLTMKFKRNTDLFSITAVTEWNINTKSFHFIRKLNWHRTSQRVLSNWKSKWGRQILSHTKQGWTVIKCIESALGIPCSQLSFEMVYNVVNTILEYFWSILPPMCQHDKFRSQSRIDLKIVPLLQVATLHFGSKPQNTFVTLNQVQMYVWPTSIICDQFTHDIEKVS